jgi:poly-gamma-glutamate capsule biosynthesis protein CapA/YwtB (metallophosphatase superfamily)
MREVLSLKYFGRIFNQIILKFFLFQVFLLVFTLQFSFNSYSQESDTSLVTIIGVGDIMMGTSFPSKKYLPPSDTCDFLLVGVKDYLRDADVTFGNLEGCFLDHGKVVKKCKDSTLCYAFRTPEKYFDCLVDAGFDVLSLANNHINDFGEPGIERTLALIEQNNLHAAGLLDRPYEVFERGGVKFGFCAFSPNKGTTRINDYPAAEKIIAYLEEVSDIVIVSFHGGAEGKDYQNVKCKTEMFYGEDRGNVCEFARMAIDAGADIVFGHGPHVTRSIDLYNDRLIAYSLGNFCTYKRMNLSGPNGVAPILKVYTDKAGRFQKAIIIPVIQHENAGPVYDPANKAVKIIQKLVMEDFPESELSIHSNGTITKK